MCPGPAPLPPRGRLESYDFMISYRWGKHDSTFAERLFLTTFRVYHNELGFYTKLRAAAPCGDLGGFTRLLSTPGGRPDKLVNEIPTVVVKQLGWGKCDECDHGFVVLNRPWSLLQLTRSPVRC